VWTEITLPVTSVVTEGFYIHSYDGSTIAELDCGAYEFRVVAGETWWFEPFTVEDFEFTENAYKLRDLLMTPLKFSEQLVSCGSIVAPCDSFLPFMYTTENATSGTPTYTLVSLDGTETALTITVDVLTIDGRTYYIHDGECFYPFLECGRYYIRIDDGAYVYFSAWFDAVCEMNDIPDGYRAMRDANGCVMRDDEGEILTEECADMPEPFMITIDTTKAGSAADTFILPVTAISGDYTVDWGDGTEETFTTIGNKSHTYAAQGIYQVSVSGGMTALSLLSGGEQLKLIYIDQWGDIEWSSMYQAFAYCSNMTGRYIDIPNTSAATNFELMFLGCSVFNQAVAFDTSAATKMSYMFDGCTAFNQSVASFDTFLVDDMRFMFRNCAAFNQSVSNFNTVNVTLIASMFRGCTVFNQSVANFDTSLIVSFDALFMSCAAFNQSVASFDTSSATVMTFMFYGCISFNQSVATFDTSSVTTMQQMFGNCSAFKQSLATFSLTSIAFLNSMLEGCDINAAGTSTNYDNTLIAWAAADVPNSITFHGGTSKYSDTGQAARTSLINDDLWTITADGGHI